MQSERPCTAEWLSTPTSKGYKLTFQQPKGCGEGSVRAIGTRVVIANERSQ